MSTTRLADFVVKKAIRAESIPGFEEMEVLGVSNKLGITVTDHKKSKDLAKYLLIEEGDFAYNPYRINVGSIGLVPAGKRGLVSPAYVVFKTTDELIPELLLDFLKSQEGLRQIGKYARGTVRKALRFEDLAQIELPVPPKGKQKEILAQRKSIEVEVASVKSELTDQQTLLKKLRQQILQEAIEGKLTAAWRAQNPNVEPASELLKRIAVEKAQLVKDKKIKVQKPLRPMTDKEKPFELPQGWEWCRLGDVAYGFQYGTSSKSKKSGDVPVLRMGNIQSGEVDWNGLVYSSDTVEIEKYRLIEGDLLFNRTNSRELVGKTALYRGCQTAIYAGYLVRFHMAGSILPDYANIVMNSRLHSEWCDEVKTDALGQSNINATKLSGFRFPLAPIDEQETIIDKADKLLAICDQLETQITQNQTHAEQLMQAVLKEAFSHNSAAEPAAKKSRASADAPEAARA